MAQIEYGEPTDDMVATLKEQLRNHPALTECGAVIGITVARCETGPAVKLHGTAAFATVKVISAKDRTKKRIDAEITLDGGEWDQLIPAQRASLLDHELMHLSRCDYDPKRLAKLRRENPDHPAWVLDCHGRPKLKSVPADMTPGDAFAECIERHGENAIEFVGAKRFHQFATSALKRSA